MAKRDNHYEAAFEQYLRAREIPYIAVDEAKRARLGGATLKSLDFIVSPPLGPSWLVDVKGRHFPAGKQYWKNWSTHDDVRSLTAWQRLFGNGFQNSGFQSSADGSLTDGGGSFRALFVFAYEVLGDRSPVPAEQLFQFHNRLYGFVGITLDDYARLAHPLSAAWDTLTVSTVAFRQAAAPVEHYFCQVPEPEHAADDFLSLAAMQ